MKKRLEKVEGDDALQKAVVFSAAAAAILGVFVLAFVAITRLGVFDAGFGASVAIAVGVVATILLGVGLMALSFYSSRSGADSNASGEASGINDRTFDT